MARIPTAGLFGAALCLGSVVVNAQETGGFMAGLKGEGEFGFMRTTGNTQTESLAAKFGLSKEIEQWRHSGRLEATTKKDLGVTTAERYYGVIKSDYKFSELGYAFGTADYEADRFSGYDSQANEALGVGYRVINQATFTLDAEAGPGARQSNFADGGSDNELTLRLAGNLAWKISPTATFTEELSSTIGEETTVNRSYTALTAKIVEMLALKASYLVKNTSDVPEGYKQTDTEFGVTLVFSF